MGNDILLKLHESIIIVRGNIFKNPCVLITELFVDKMI